MSKDAAGPIDRIAPTNRPNESPAGYQRWRTLLFVHWRIPAIELEPLLPDRLTVDTYDGSAWVGIVAFHMTGVRPWWSPPVPGLSSFHETNVRTYVHLDGGDPGVWFFSLDASNSPAVRLARWRWRLEYHRAVMSIRTTGLRVRYESERLWPGRIGIGGTLEAEYGDRIGGLDRNRPAGQAVPGTLEHFLAERYLLYTQHPDGRLLRGRVHHAPYPLREAEMLECRQTLLAAAGIKPHSDVAHVLYSEGVDVSVFPLRPV